MRFGRRRGFYVPAGVWRSSIFCPTTVRISVWGWSIEKRDFRPRRCGPCSRNADSAAVAVTPLPPEPPAKGPALFLARGAREGVAPPVKSARESAPGA